MAAARTTAGSYCRLTYVEEDPPLDFRSYRLVGFCDEAFETENVPREAYRRLVERIDELPAEEISRRRRAAEAALHAMGITFTVYGEGEGTERIFPFDIIPRIVSAEE